MSKTQPLVDRHVLIDNSRIAYGIHGPAEGIPVVLLHGTPSSSLIWRNVLPHLTKAGYRVHLYDLLGYGLSERPWDPAIDTSISAQVPILERLMTHWKLAAAHIIAHDIGGGIVQRLAVLSPDRLRSLTLVDAVSFNSYPSTRTKEQLAQGLDPLLRQPDTAHREHFAAWLLSAVHQPERLAASSLDAFVGYIAGPVGQASLFQHQIRHYDSKHTMEVAGRLGELGRLPVHIVWGREDRWQVLDWARKLHEAIPGSVLSVVDGAGHFSPEDKPDEIAELIVGFLGRLR